MVMQMKILGGDVQASEQISESKQEHITPNDNYSGEKKKRADSN